jgi:hypothetical protein
MAAFLLGFSESKPPMSFPREKAQRRRPPITFTCAILFPFHGGHIFKRCGEKNEPTNFLHEIEIGKGNSTYILPTSGLKFSSLLLEMIMKLIRVSQNNMVKYFRTSYCASHIYMVLLMRIVIRVLTIHHMLNLVV